MGLVPVSLHNEMVLLFPQAMASRGDKAKLEDSDIQREQDNPVPPFSKCTAFRNFKGQKSCKCRRLFVHFHCYSIRSLNNIVLVEEYSEKCTKFIMITVSNH